MATFTDTKLVDDHNAEAAQQFKLVGYTRFVRTNPRSDRFPVLGFHHVEFWCADAISAAGRFSFALGAPISAFSGLSTSNHFHSSHLLRSHDLRFLFSSPLPPIPTTDNQNHFNSLKPPIPSFDRDRCLRFSNARGLAVRAVAIRVADAASAFEIAVRHGARPAFPPADLGQGFSLAEVELYGGVVLRLISHPDVPLFLPGFEGVEQSAPSDYGITSLDHAVGNVPELGPALSYVAGFTGFHEFAEFTAEDVGTAESGLNSVALANNEERVLLLMNEPVQWTARRSQIQTYLDYNGGPGVQHLAVASDDVFRTVREMRRRTPMGGFDFMPPPPPTYYTNLKKRVGDVLSAEQMKDCEELGVLVDRDDQGVLLQIFTKPVGDRPTIFLEIIQRIGCMFKNAQGKSYQKGGCGGFGKGNISELFKSVEEYEKSLEGK